MKTARPTYAETATISELTLILGKIEIGDCWQWLGYSTTNGYSGWVFRGRNTRMHRFMYELLKGRIPTGLVIDHLCRNKLCVNPKHLEVVTQSVNTLRGVHKSGIGKTHCIRGHEFTEKNTYRSKTGRVCRACRVINNTKSRNKQRLLASQEQ